MKNETHLDAAAIASECARYITADSPVAVSMVEGIRRGNLELVSRLLKQNDGIATVRVGEANKSKTWLHVVTDWPGYFPNGPAVVRALIEAGADPNATIGGAWHSETPLHWAASSDDVEVAEALIIGGANVQAMGGSIAGGTPLDNAIGYGCWRVARMLAEHGVQIEKLWHAAALGMRSHVESFFDKDPAPQIKEINDAFWQACHGGHRWTAEYLLARGADLNWIPDYAKQTPLDVAAGPETGREALVNFLREKGAKSSLK